MIVGTDSLLEQLGIGGIFAILTVKQVLDFLGRRNVHMSPPETGTLVERTLAVQEKVVTALQRLQNTVEQLANNIQRLEASIDRMNENLIRMQERRGSR